MKFQLSTTSKLRRPHFPGSPTLLVNGRDVETGSPSQVGFACRTYVVEGKPLGCTSALLDRTCHSPGKETGGEQP